jgi:hypothetical protein
MNVQVPEIIQLEQKIVIAILQYLETRPLGEVKGLHTAISDEVIKQATPVDTETKEEKNS